MALIRGTEASRSKVFIDDYAPPRGAHNISAPEVKVSADELEDALAPNATGLAEGPRISGYNGCAIGSVQMKEFIDTNHCPTEGSETPGIRQWGCEPGH